MKKGLFLHSLICILAVSCTVQEIEPQTPPYEPAPGDDVFYASLDPESGTKVYLDENIKILWDEADQISIFNKTTLNQKYEFLGETGDNAGYFKKKSDGTGTGSAMDYVCAVYPYKKATTLSDSGVLTLTLPEEQTYREGSFGLEANTMVSTNDGSANLLRFKNACGYMVIKLYGQGPDESNISISSIKLEGRNGELLSGEATMTPVEDEIPVIEMASTAGTSITLKCDKAVKLGKTEKKATLFWMVVPPTRFSQGLKITVTDKDGKVFVRESDVDLTIERNGVKRLSAIEVTPDVFLEPNKVIYYSTSDKAAITPNENADFGANFVDSYYSEASKLCVMVFDGEVTAIGDNAFENCETLTDITIPGTVTSIGDFAFARCTSLGAQITPASTNSKAPAKAPARSGETTIVIPEGVTSIGAYAFENCTSLTSIVIPDGVTSIGAYAFLDCENLTSIIIPDSVTSIGEQAFWGCSNLVNISIPDSVEHMGNDIVGGRTGITSVTIPDGTTSIANYAYAGCENLSEVIIPESVTSIGDYAFFMCSGLTSIDIPSSVTTIGKHAFESCDFLTGITIPAGVTKIEEAAFAGCHSFTSIVIPDNVKIIGASAFDCCVCLSDITLPYGLTSIWNYAFAECHELTNITIPSTVSNIGGYILQNCENLISITVEAIEPPDYVYEDAFLDTNDCPIYVPAGSVNAYRQAEVWNLYASRIYAIGPQTGTINDHAYVDLGTGAKWATMNVGATSIAESGDLFTWSDGKAAAENWGGNWRLPTKDELEILMDESKFTWTWDSTNEGYNVESKIQGYVGNTIFLPTTGFIDPSPESAGTFDYLGCYWSSTPGEVEGSYHLEFEEGQETLLYDCVHEVSLGVRPVAD